MAESDMSRRRGPSSPPLEDDDLLQEILLRLPPQPPYLLRASIVSKRWRRLATDPKFLRRFRIHHRKPPLLGDFSHDIGAFSFRSNLDPPYRIPPLRFSLRPTGSEGWNCLDIRHGRVLFDDWRQGRIILWDPVAEDRRIVAYPTQFHDSGIVQIHTGAVLCAAADDDQGHVHGACRSSPFKVVALSSHGHDDEDVDESVAFASVYSSETGAWTNILSAALSHRRSYFSRPTTLVGNTLHCLMNSGDIFEFDLDAQRLAVTKRPPGAPHGDNARIIQAEDGGVGFVALSNLRHHSSLRIWERKLDSHGVATWVLQKTVELQKILGLEPRIEKGISSSILYYLEDVHAIFLRVDLWVYLVQLQPMKSKKLFKRSRNSMTCLYWPFTSFWTEGNCLLILTLQDS